MICIWCKNEVATYYEGSKLHCSRKCYNQQYYSKNKEEILLEKQGYYQENKEEILKNKAETYKIDPIKENLRCKRYYQETKEEQRPYKRNYCRNRRQQDIQFKLTQTLRTRLNCALNGNQKVGSAIDDLGCSIEELKKRLEDKFYHDPETGEVMSWENHSIHGWHIDHIKPLVLFDLTNREELLKACHYSNLQPLWAKDNLSKGSK